MIVQKTSVFPASRDVVFQKLQRLETLQTIAKPYATFEPLGNATTVWTVGSKSSYRLRLFGFIPFGTHTIRIVRFDPDGVSSREKGVFWLDNAPHVCTITNDVDAIAAAVHELLKKV